jgi:hypothetical protein
MAWAAASLASAARMRGSISSRSRWARRLHELAAAQAEVDRLYARWAELEATAQA